MKKVLLLAAAAGIVLSGCVKNEPAETFGASDAKITFEAPAVGATTRAIPGEIDNSAAYPERETFNVWGWYHEGDYTTFGALDNAWTNYMTQADGKPVTVAKEGNTWAPATDYFWPKTGKLTFAAYSPADAAGTYTHTAEGLQIAGFTVPAIGDQYDLMYSDRAYNRTSSTNQYPTNDPDVSNGYEGVDIVFHHALSSIVFKVGTKENYSTGADIDFKIKSIKIKNVYNAGNFNETLTDGNGSTTRTPAWTATGNADAQYVAFTGDFAVPEDGTTYTEPTGAADLILLPQSFEGNDAAVVEIAYTYETAASGEIAATETFILKNSTNAKTWEPNKRYTYRILFGLEKITFAPIVENWEDVTVEPGINL